MATGSVIALHLKPASGQLASVNELTAQAGVGFVGDRCAGSKKRQALLVSTESLVALGLEPGVLREQITVDLPGLQELLPGTVVQVGEVQFEITQDCEPCSKMAKYVEESPDEFKARTNHNRGMLACVKTSGKICLGDKVQVV